jgi:signal transduction histidine kinase
VERGVGHTAYDEASKSATAVGRHGDQIHVLLARYCGNRPVSATVDAEPLERALLNLLSNAHKYGRDGGTIHLSLERRSRELVFTVADDGPDIPEADRARIFERFYRPKREAPVEAGGAAWGCRSRRRSWN